MDHDVWMRILDFIDYHACALLRETNVMQARWLYEAQQENKLFKDKVRQLIAGLGMKEGDQ